VHPALLAAGSVRDAGVAGRPPELPPSALAPRGGLPCGAPFPGLFGTSRHSVARWRPRRLSVTGPSAASRTDSVLLTALFSEEKALTRVSVPRCRSSSGCPGGCGASFDPVRDCSRVSWAPSILRTPFRRRAATPAPSRRRSAERLLFPFPTEAVNRGSDRRRASFPRGGRSAEALRCRC